MTPRLRWLAVSAIVLLVGYGAMLAVWPEARPSIPSPIHSAQSSHGSAKSDSQDRPKQGGYETIAAEIVIPSAAEVGELKGCPMTQLGVILGVGFSNPHGLTVGEVLPEGPAAGAGVKAGDQLGLPSQCPATTIGHFRPDEEPRTVEVTIRRWKPRETEGAEEAEAPSGAEEQPSEPASEAAAELEPEKES